MSADILAMAAKIRDLRTLNTDVAEEAAPAVLSAARATASAGTTPTGEAWAPLKKGTGKPLKNAAASISSEPIGAIIEIQVAAPEFFHTTGRGSPKRTIIPDVGDDIPPGMSKAIATVAAKVFARKVGT